MDESMFNGETIVSNKVGPERAKELAENLELDIHWTSLDLTGSEIKANGAKAIGNALKYNTNLKSLNLQENYMKSTAKHLFAGLFENETLETLILRANVIENKEAMVLSKCLQSKQKGIKHLDLSRNPLKEFPGITEALRDNITLRTLNLSYGNLSKQGMTSVLKGLESNKSITKLDLTEYSSLLKHFPDELANILMKNSTLTDFNLEGETRYDKNTPSIAFVKSLEVNSSLKRLNLGYWSLTAESMKYLVEPLKKNKALKALHLTGNKIDPIGIKYLVEGLLENESITELAIDRNLIKDEGLIILLDFMDKKKSLTELNVEINNITDVGLDALSNFIKDDSTVKSVSPSWNDFTNSGVINFCNSLIANKTVESVVLRNCGWDKYSLPAITELINKNKTITSLSLSSMAVTEDVYLDEAFTEAVEFNDNLKVLDLHQFRSNDCKSQFIKKIYHNELIVSLGERFEDEYFLKRNIKIQESKMKRYKQIKEVKTYDIKFLFASIE